eukprot:1354356-Amorphochlora_amoeboformis.AAC.1
MGSEKGYSIIRYQDIYLNWIFFDYVAVTLYCHTLRDTHGGSDVMLMQNYETFEEGRWDLGARDECDISWNGDIGVVATRKEDGATPTWTP